MVATLPRQRFVLPGVCMLACMLASNHRYFLLCSTPRPRRIATPHPRRYANLCADMVRAALKEPLKAKAKGREAIYFRQSLWKDGVPQKQGGWTRPQPFPFCLSAVNGPSSQQGGSAGSRSRSQERAAPACSPR